MYTYKTLEHLKKRAIKNNGKEVNIFDDEGIKVNGKIYRQMEYGNMGYNFTGNCYVTFRNTGKKGRQPTYANKEKFTCKDNFITIEYMLHNTNIFEFITIRETW